MSSEDLSAPDVAIATPAADKSLAEVAAALRDSHASGQSVSIAGAGTKATWGGPARPTDVVLSTAGLSGVVEYAPGDLVVTVRAGTPLADLQGELAEHNHWLALDPPEAAATVGGIVATAASGPHRLRFGTPRDQLIGITVALADGTVAKSGGKVVKNVAGYDLGKLFTGSFGTLGVIVQATFKLQPRPPARRVVTVEAPEPGAAAKAIAGSTVAPVAAEWDGSRVHVLLQAAATAIEGMAMQLAAALGTTEIGERLPAAFGSRPWAPGEIALKVTHRLSALDAVVAGVRHTLPGARFSAHVGSGVIWCGWRAPKAADVGAVIGELRALAASYDGTVVVVDAPAAVKTEVDAWGPVAAVDMMHRVKDQFDPDHRLNPGRFVDGI